MTSEYSQFANLSDDQLLAEVQRLASKERRATVALVRSLIELDARRLYLREGCSSLFTYCTQVLRLPEGSAYNRIEVARSARRYPALLDHLEDGTLTLTTARLLAPHLTSDNHREVLTAARSRSKREVEVLIASMHPRPAQPPSVRKLPVRQFSPLVETAASEVAGADAARDIETLRQGERDLRAACDPGTDAAAERDPAGTRPLQDPAHRVDRRPRQTAARAGHAPSHNPHR